MIHDYFVAEIDGKRISSANDVYTLLSATKSRALRMSVYREGKMFQVQVTPEDLG